MAKKKYRIINSFIEGGKDGKKKGVTLGPGEEVPAYIANDPNRREELIARGKICEVAATGENIRRESQVDMSLEKTRNYLKNNNPASVIRSIRNVNFSEKTITQMHTLAETSNMPKEAKQKIQQAIDQKLGVD